MIEIYAVIESIAKKVIPVLTISSGFALSLSGLIGIVFYIISFSDIKNQPDKSVAFWYLPFLMFGIILLISGIDYIVVGLKAAKGNNTAHKYIRYFLVIAGILVLVISLLTILN